MSEKKKAAVRLEGTITDGADTELLHFGEVKPGVNLKLAALQEEYDVIVVSAAVKYDGGGKRLWHFLIDSQLPFFDVWCGDGLPSVDLWVDDNAVKL